MTGGVCAVLDYEVELMAEYVAEMATRLALGSTRATDSFRKFISQILSSTRLPRTTILLGMNYFAKRINTMVLTNTAKVPLSEGHVWRLVTVGLLLGSKFLDDNTFQNRSWADVSGIPVCELNKLEREWMGAISWCLYVNLDLSADYTAWISSWKEWETSKKSRPVILPRERHSTVSSPTEIDFVNPHNPAYAQWYQQQVAEYERLSRTKHNEQSLQTYRPSEHTWSYHPQADAWRSAPITPPDSGYGTPDYMNSAAAINSQYDDWFSHHAPQAASRAVTNGSYGRHQYPPANMTTYHHSRNAPTKLPGYNFYGHNIWEHSMDNRHIPYFGVSHPYGQPVMG